MEKPTEIIHIEDETVIRRVNGKSLRYFQLRSDLRDYLKRDSKEFLKSDMYSQELPNAIVRFLGQKNILEWGEQVTGFKKLLLDKLIEDFDDPGKFLLKDEKLSKKENPLFQGFEDTKGGN